MNFMADYLAAQYDALKGRNTGGYMKIATSPVYRPAITPTAFALGLLLGTMMSHFKFWNLYGALGAATVVVIYGISKIRANPKYRLYFKHREPLVIGLWNRHERIVDEALMAQVRRVGAFIDAFNAMLERFNRLGRPESMDGEYETVSDNLVAERVRLQDMHETAQAAGVLVQSYAYYLGQVSALAP